MPKQGEEAEKKVQEFLEKKFGKPFSKQKIVIGKGKKKEFDLVSNDGKIVAEVKDFKFGNENGYSNTHKPRLITACAYLKQVQAERKILALTKQEMYERFQKDMNIEQLHPEIEIIYVPMSLNSDNDFIRSKSVGDEEDGMSNIRNRGINYIEKHFGKLTGDKRVSKFHSDQECWWHEPSLKNLCADGELHLICQCETGEAFYYLRIPIKDINEYIKQGYLDIRIKSGVEVLDMQLSAKSDKYFHDLRGKGKIDFSRYLQKQKK